MSPVHISSLYPKFKKKKKSWPVTVLTFCPSQSAAKPHTQEEAAQCKALCVVRHAVIKMNLMHQFCPLVSKLSELIGCLLRLDRVLMGKLKHTVLNVVILSTPIQEGGNTTSH